MRSRLTSALTAAASAVLLVLAPIGLTAAAASAAGSPASSTSDMQWRADILGTPAQIPARAADQCPSGYFCFWVDAEFRGTMGKVRYSNRTWTAFAQSACRSRTWNDCASSYWNRTGYTVIVYRDANYAGASARLDNVPRTVSSSWNDVISSNVVVR